MNTISRLLLAAGFLVISGCCLFGFLASYESPDFWIWRIGYGTVGSLCAVAALGTAFGGRRLNSG